MGSCSVATRRRCGEWRLAIALAATLVATTTLQGCPDDCGGVAKDDGHIITVDVEGLALGEAFSVTAPAPDGREIACPGPEGEGYRCAGPGRVVLEFGLTATNPPDVDIAVVSESGKTGTATVETRDLNDECESTADSNHYEVTVVLE